MPAQPPTWITSSSSGQTLQPGRQWEAFPAFSALSQPNSGDTCKAISKCTFLLTGGPAPHFTLLHTCPTHPVCPAALPLLPGRQRAALPTTVPAEVPCVAHKGPAEVSCHLWQTEISHCCQTGRKVAPPTMTPAQALPLGLQRAG